MTIQHLFPTAKPTLDLNFAGERSLDPRITFSRSSIGTYVDEDGIIRYAAEDEPRFDYDPVTGESLGLLLEQSRTNHCQHSGIDPTNWTQDGTSSLAVSSIPAPDGGTCHDLTTDNGGNNSIRFITTSAPAGNSAMSVFARFPNSGFTALNIRQLGTPAGATFYADYYPATDSWSGEVNCTGFSKDFGNGWKRLILVPSKSSTNGNATIRIGGGINSSAFTQQTCQIWGAQLERGSYLTSYIPTSGAAEDRDADIFTIAGDNFSSWYNPIKSTMVVNMSCKRSTDYGLMWGFYGREGAIEGYPGKGTPFEGLIFFRGDDNTQKYIGREGAGGAVWNQEHKIEKCAYSWDFSSGEGTACISGNFAPISPPDTGVPMATITDGFRLMGGQNSSNVTNSGIVSSVAYYPRRLSDEQLKALTS